MADLKGQTYAAFNIKDQEDPDKVALFCMSVGKFWSIDRGNAGLKKELEEGDEEDLDFYHVRDGGKTLKVRFSEDTYKGAKFLKATKIDFKKRKEMDEEKMREITVASA